MATKVFAVVAKQQEENNPFFHVVRQGCEARAAELGNVVCTVRGPEQAVASAQVAIARQFIADGVDGLAIASLDEELTALVIEEAYAAGIPVVTFDSDAPRSKRLAYIGTNNFAFGQTLGKILWQLKPLGGQYAILSEGSPNTLERNAGVRDHLENSPWVEARNSPSDTEDNIIMAAQQVGMFSRQAGVSAVVAVGGWPMYGPDLSVWQNIVDANRNITYVVADTLPIQIEHLSTGYVNGLVGQDPYQMGVQTMNVLLEHATNGGNGTVQTGDMFGTAFMEMVRVPLELPPAIVDYHYIGNLRYMGIAFFTVIFLMSFVCAHWTFSKRHVRVVTASQPQFLLMICFGVLVCASSLLTVSFDDSKVGYSGSTANGLCMSIPWLTSLGFTIMFSALFSKTRRINKIFHDPFPYERMKVSFRELYLPMVLLFTANVANLTIWTFIAPLKYSREVNAGTDGWNRAISSHGTCTSDGAAPFIATLFLINMTTLMIANWQSYEARDIQSEFAESMYIAIAMACVLQASLTGLPILFLTQEIPTVRYVVFVLMIFMVNAVVLLLIFVPKMRAERISQVEDEKDKRHHLEAVHGERMALRLKRASLITNDDAASGDGMGLSKVSWLSIFDEQRSFHGTVSLSEPIGVPAEEYDDVEGNSPKSSNLQEPPTIDAVCDDEKTVRSLDSSTRNALSAITCPIGSLRRQQAVGTK